MYSAQILSKACNAVGKEHKPAGPKIGVTLPICAVIKLEWAVINLSWAMLNINLVWY